MKKSNHKVIIIGYVIICLLVFVIGVLIGKGMAGKTDSKVDNKVETIEDIKKNATEDVSEKEIQVEDEGLDYQAMDGHAIKVLEDVKNSWQTMDEPLVIYQDMNGDDVHELVVMFRNEEPDGVPGVNYQYWIVSEDSAQKLMESQLYREVGGNYGTLAFARNTGTDQVYFCIEKHMADGDGFEKELLMIALDPDSALNTNKCMVFQMYGDSDGNRNCYINGTCVSESEYNAEIDSFAWGDKMDLWADEMGEGINTLDTVLEALQ